MSREQVVGERGWAGVVSAILEAISGFLPGFIGPAVSAIADVFVSVYEALANGGSRESTVNAMKQALVAASDAAMREELGANT